MIIGTLKGALLEYIIRKLLKSCGFTNVKADDLYTYESSGLFFVNGKGAAHDADIIMNPPIQMPFSYPTQLVFECKAYGPTVPIAVIRGASGLRHDINEFEIVTKDHILKRKDNRRASYAVETRIRFIYQVGVASINDFSKPAVEFATNNKIPLLSLSWFLSHDIIEKINAMDKLLLDSFNPAAIKNLYVFFKDRNGNINDHKYSLANELINSNNPINEILDHTNLAIDHSFIGLLETGDLVFLFARTPNNILSHTEGNGTMRAEIHWFSDRPNVWRLTVHPRWGESESEYDFFLPVKIMDHWKQFNLNKEKALDIKAQFFSKIFVFNRGNNEEMPFTIINIDQEWLERARRELRNDATT